MQVRYNGVHYASYTGLDYALTDFALYSLGLESGVATAVTPDSTALYTGLRSGNDVIYASDLGKDISGYAGNDTIYGKGGDDWLEGGTGVDRFYGGTGIDGVSFTEVGAGGHGVRVNMALSTGNILDDGYDNVETATGVEIYQGSKFRDRIVGGLQDDTLWGEDGGDTLIGSAGNDALNGGDGSDLVTGDAGNDTVMGGTGADTLDGGTGVNLLTFWDLAAPGHGVRVNLSRVTGQVIDDGYGTTDNATHFQNLAGTEFGDRLAGGAGANIIWAEAGADRLFGGGGNDSLYGYTGRDSIFGGSGDDEIEGDKDRDYFDGGAGNDHLGFWDVDTTGHGIVVDLSLATQDILDDGYGNIETAVGFETVSGSAHNDSITGSALAELLWGNDGSDSLNGAGGNDTLMGGYGPDAIYGGDGNDVIWSFNNAGKDTVGGGHDTIGGGAGADVFNFSDNSPDAGWGVAIVDMTAGIDKIGLGAWWSTALTGQTGLKSSQFLSEAQNIDAHTPDQHVIYDPLTGQLWFDVDGSGTNYNAIYLGSLFSQPALTYQDFILTA